MIVDAHQHFWNPDTVEYSWLTPESGVLYRTYAPADLAPELRAAGVDRTVLVQAANSLAETDAMLAHADAHPFIAGVVGWIDLTDPAGAAAALDRYRRHPAFVGVRHLIHEEPDPDWLVRDGVLESLGLLAAAGLAFDVVSLLPRHLDHVVTVAERHPGLKLVVDHLSKPRIRDHEWEPWATKLATAASYPNVCAKVSGLVTEADHERWTVEDLRPYVDYAVERFGPERLMFGSDWPVVLRASDYRTVFQVTHALLGGTDTEQVFGGTAVRVYGLDREVREPS
ncbi:amidohydrolase family protein [Nonomuraea sp. MCN248]|uniref:Amidohydrolase family protein n=1 Tax=Nonomuraea corallina TaxID=2989783 RepID=A0ABT4SEV4_9ACTN|nr:amidohydrolase family protein [Nonomuraea corallina]MDA0635680.1 amidohydrolase family protein [Nonomuraea corallina]